MLPYEANGGKAPDEEAAPRTLISQAKGSLFLILDSLNACVQLQFQSSMSSINSELPQSDSLPYRIFAIGAATLSRHSTSSR
jgi:hypothetical protein